AGRRRSGHVEARPLRGNAAQGPRHSRRLDGKAETALFITFDEGGGYYDSGFIQPLDFFGDGPRTPLIVVSPFSTGGHVVHNYTDHVSILKFIERNWGLAPLTGRSRDNLPNPRAKKDDPYVPVNSPAIGDLFDMFDFSRGDQQGNCAASVGYRAAE